MKQQTEPKEKVHKRRKTDDSLEEEVSNKDDEPEALYISDQESFSTPPKKTKRQRYCSDATNATRSASKKFEAHSLSINPFLQDDVKSDYEFDDFQLNSALHFASESFKLGTMKVDTQFHFIEQAEESPANSFDMQYNFDIGKFQWE